MDYNAAVARVNGGQGTLDVHFWTSIIDRLALNKKFHFKSVGSKQTLKSIGDDVQREGISSISVCLDRDYDEHLNRLHGCGRVCYTYGYSWENDTVSVPVIETIVRDFIGIGQKQDGDIQTLRQNLYEFQQSLSYWVEIDIALLRLGKPSVFLRSNPNASLDFDNHPSLRVSALRKSLRDAGYKSRPKRWVNLDCNSTLRVCFGKLISHAIFHCIGEIFDEYGIRKLTYDQFMRLAISRTAQMFDQAELAQFSAYFRSQAQALH